MEMPGRRGITFIPDQGVTEQGVHVQVKYMYLIMILDPDHKEPIGSKETKQLLCSRFSSNNLEFVVTRLHQIKLYFFKILFFYSFGAWGDVSPTGKFKHKNYNILVIDYNRSMSTNLDCTEYIKIQ